MKNIHIKSATFTGAVQEATKSEKSGWSGENHRAIVNTVIGGLEEEDGKTANLEEHVKNVILLACCPTPELKLQVVKEALAAVGYQLDENTAATLALLSDSGSFANFLAKTDNPKTGKPFITKTSKTQKRDAFKALLGGGSDGKPIAQNSEATVKAEEVAA